MENPTSRKRKEGGNKERWRGSKGRTEERRNEWGKVEVRRQERKMGRRKKEGGENYGAKELLVRPMHLARPGHVSPSHH